MKRTSIAVVALVIALVAGFGGAALAQTFFPYAVWYDVTLIAACPSSERPIPILVPHLGEIHLYYHCNDGTTKIRVFRGAAVPTSTAGQSMVFPPELYAR